MYHTSSCRFFRIDSATRRFLEFCRTGPLPEAKERTRTQAGIAPTAVESIAREVSFLAEHGLFDVPDYSISGEALERQLERRYSLPWNKLELALSEVCNLACSYCYCGTCRSIIPNHGLMSEATARQAIDWLFDRSGRADSVNITFFGGEPLMNKPVLRFSIGYSQRLAKRHGKKVSYSMTTNGTLLDDEVIGFIKRHNFGLMVSLDGPPQIHDAQCPNRHGKGSFEAAAAGIKKLMARRRAVTVRCTMTHPVPRMLDLIKFFEGFGFSRIVLGRAVNPLHPSPVDCTQEDFRECERQEREEIIPWILQKAAAGESPKYYPYAPFIAALSEGTVSPPVSAFKCGACRGTTTVGADGTLYPCHRFLGMRAWSIGGLSEGPDLERCKQFWREYRAAIGPGCQQCWLWAYCHGPCPWEIAEPSGTFSQAHRHCDYMKEYAKRSAYIYLLTQVQPAMRASSSSSHPSCTPVEDAGTVAPDPAILHL